MDGETKPDDMGDEYDPRRLRDVTYVRHHNGYSVGGKHDGSGAWVMMRAEPDGPWRKRVVVARAVATQSACIGLTVAELEGVSVKAMREALREALPVLAGAYDEHGLGSHQAIDALDKVRAALGAAEKGGA